LVLEQNDINSAYVVESSQEEDKACESTAENHHAGSKQQIMTQSEVNLYTRTLYIDLY